jgi:cation transport ATPase
MEPHFMSAKGSPRQNIERHKILDYKPREFGTPRSHVRLWASLSIILNIGFAILPVLGRNLIPIKNMSGFFHIRQNTLSVLFIIFVAALPFIALAFGIIAAIQSRRERNGDIDVTALVGIFLSVLFLVMMACSIHYS